MDFAGRVRALKRRVERRALSIPTDPFEFYEGLLAGRFTLEDLDRRNPVYTSWIGSLAAALMRQPAHAGEGLQE